MPSPSTIELSRLNVLTPGAGPWRVVEDIRNRSINIRNVRNGYIHRVYYGTRTQRTIDDATLQATAFCTILNLFRAKRP